jgi:hypothetical protein
MGISHRRTARTVDSHASHRRRSVDRQRARRRLPAHVAIRVSHLVEAWGKLRGDDEMTQLITEWHGRDPAAAPAPIAASQRHPLRSIRLVWASESLRQ